MEKRTTLFVVLILTTLFTLLFHNQYLGLNLLIFELVVILYLIFSKSIKGISPNLPNSLFFGEKLRLRNLKMQVWRDAGKLSTPKLKMISAALVITGVATVLTSSNFSYTIHFLICFLLLGILIFPIVKSPITSIELSIYNLISSQVTFYKKATQVQILNKKPAAFLWDLRLFIIPTVIIFIFISIYNFSNPLFNEMTSGIFSGMIDMISEFLERYDLSIAFTVIFGLVISNAILFRNSNTKIIKKDISSLDFLISVSSNSADERKHTSIKNEITAAVFLLTFLNIALLTLNIIDINWVWFGFEWQGQYLKQFVHEGTWLLIFSIMLSIIIILYFYRGEINFAENKLLKYLSYFWILQNVVLAISVGIRNYYYIEYFNLAYKRIGVIIFLIMTIYGLYTVLRKVRFKHSASYLIRTNVNAFLIIITVASLFNWDVIIAKYNFNHKESAFIHFNYLVTLSDKALPFLNKPIEELNQIEASQEIKYPQESNLMSAEIYFNHIEKRKIRFKNSWENKSWLAWNLPEQLAYTKLKKSENW